MMQEPIRYAFDKKAPAPVVLETGYTESVLFTDEHDLPIVNPALTFYSGWPTAEQADADEDMLTVLEEWDADRRVLFAWPYGAISPAELREFAESRRQAIIAETGRAVDSLDGILMLRAE